MLGPPLGLEAVDVAPDLCRSRTERTDVRHQLGDLARRGIDRQTVCGQCRPERAIGGDRRMPDAVDRLDGVTEPDRVEATPGAGCVHARVDLEVQVTVRVAGPRRVVPDDRCLDPLDRHLNLAVARTDAGGGVPRNPTDDLVGRLVLSRVECVGDLGVQGRRE